MMVISLKNVHRNLKSCEEKIEWKKWIKIKLENTSLMIKLNKP